MVVNKKKLSGSIIFIYIFIMPFTAALAPDKHLPLPLLYALIALFILFLLYAENAIVVFKSDMPLFLVIVLGFLPWMLHTSLLGGKNLGHGVGICASVFLFFLVVRSALLKCRFEQWLKLGKVAQITLLVLSCVVIVEFVSASFFNVYISDLIPYSGIEKLGRPNVFNSEWQRPRAFAAEAGFTAMYYEVMLPLAWFTRKRMQRGLGSLIWTVILIGYALLFSAASYFSIALSLYISAIVFGKRKLLLYLVLATIVMAVAITYVDTLNYIFNSVIYRKYLILTMPVSEMSDRAYIYYSSGLIGLEYPFGIGWGSLSQLYNDGIDLGNKFPHLIGAGAISLYLEVLVAAGWLGLASLLYFIVRKLHGLLKAYKYHNDRSIFAIFVGLLSISLHHAFLSEFYFPYIWFSLAMADYVIRNRFRVTQGDRF